MKKILLALSICAGFGLTGCYYDKADELFPVASPCDTVSTISFAAHVDPIISGYCKSCHSNGSGGGGVVLATYNDIVVQAQNGKLVGTIFQKPGYKPMPPVGKLDACKSRTIQKWVEGGSPNN